MCGGAKAARLRSQVSIQGRNQLLLPGLLHCSSSISHKSHPYSKAVAPTLSPLSPGGSLWPSWCHQLGKSHTSARTAGPGHKTHPILGLLFLFSFDDKYLLFPISVVIALKTNSLPIAILLNQNWCRYFKKIFLNSDIKHITCSSSGHVSYFLLITEVVASHSGA